MGAMIKRTVYITDLIHNVYIPHLLNSKSEQSRSFSKVYL